MKEKNISQQERTAVTPSQQDNQDNEAQKSTNGSPSIGLYG